MVARQGGAFLLTNLLRAVGRNGDAALEVLGPSFRGAPENVSPSRILHSIVTLGACDRAERTTEKGKKAAREQVYRVTSFDGFSAMGNSAAKPPRIERDVAQPDILVLDDAGNSFRNARDVWPRALREKLTASLPLVVYKLGLPDETSELWRHVRGRGDRLLQRTAVVIAADDLRPHGVHVSRWLSWERTAGTLAWQLEHNESLSFLREPAHLIVRFALDGALHRVRRGNRVEYRLYFDPKHTEGGFAERYAGSMLGHADAFIARLVASIAETSPPSLDAIGAGIRDGIHASRRLLLEGFGSSLSPEDLHDRNRQKSIAYPVASVANQQAGRASLLPTPLVGKRVDEKTRRKEPAQKARDAETGLIQDVLVPQPMTLERADSWTILEAWNVRRRGDLPQRIVRKGLADLMRGSPTATFGKFTTLDRGEMEGMRSIQALIREYLARPKPERPLCVAVFGPPGSGKSFGVKQVAKSIDPDAIKEITFNVAEFRSRNDLVRAFHNIHDVALEGAVPLAFFDEFDSNLDGRPLAWLKYFLAPMQDGVFEEDGTLHPVGRAILVFAGGTSRTYDAFSRRKFHMREAGKRARTEPAAFKEFREAKGPDFTSRLRGFVDVMGPDPIEGLGMENDRFFRLRRAVLVRGFVQKHAPRLIGKDDVADIDPAIVRALIEMPKYQHGARSIEAVFEASQLAGRASFEQSALPSARQLHMHLDGDRFYSLMLDQLINFGDRDRLAEEAHDIYQKAKPIAERTPWRLLREEFRNSSREQIEDIPAKLAECGYEITRRRSGGVVRHFTRNEIERLAKLEHERFEAERRMRGWVLGARDDDRCIRPSLVPWEQLPKSDRDIDRAAVRAIPTMLAKFGYFIRRPTGSRKRGAASGRPLTPDPASRPPATPRSPGSSR